MSDRHAGPADRLTLDPRIIKVLSYWDELRGTRVVPGRVEVRPSVLTQHLSRICILERPRAGIMRMRLAGATVSARMGMELRGMPLRALFDLNHRAQAVDAAETAMTTPAISFLSLGRVERHGIASEGLFAMLPLSDTRGALTRALAIYSEHPSVTHRVNDLHGRFTVQNAWTLDIPENGSILDSLGQGVSRLPFAQAVAGANGTSGTGFTPQDATQTRGFRPHLAAETTGLLNAPRPEQPRSGEPADVRKPAFQVIEGGRD